MKWSMGIAALLMSISVLLSRFMGLIRDKVISWQFGIGGDADIYFVAFTIPDFINYLLAGGYLSITLIPFLSKKFEEDKEKVNTKDTAWHFFGTVFSWIAIAIISITTLAFIFSDNLVYYIAPGFNEEQQVRLSYFLRIILFGQVFFLLGACFSAILYVRHHFTAPALMPLIYNGSILFFGIILPYYNVVDGMEGFCYGALIGAFIGAFLIPLYAVYKGGIEWHFSLKHKDFKKFLLFALPLMIGQSVVVLDEQFIRIFGSMAGEGAVSLLNYARRIMLVPVGVVAQAAALASFPFLASLVAQKKYDEFNQALLRALNASLIIILPLSAFMMVQSHNIIGLIFEGGHFTQEDTQLTNPLLQIMLISVPFWAIQQIVGRAFYAQQNTLTPALVGSFASLCVVPLYVYFTPIYGTFFVAAMTSVSLFIYTFLIVYVWDKKNKTQLYKDIVKTFSRTLFLLVPSVLFTLYASMKLSLFTLDFNPLIKHIIELSINSCVFFSLWLIFTWKLAKEDMLLLLNPILKKIRKVKNES